MIHSFGQYRLMKLQKNNFERDALGDQSEFPSYGHTHGQSQEKEPKKN